MFQYEIEQNLRETDMRYWTDILLSAIYIVWEKLEKNLCRSQSYGNRDEQGKKIYTVTDKGIKELKEKIVAIMSEMEISISQIDLALANLHLLTPKEVKHDNGCIYRIN